MDKLKNAETINRDRQRLCGVAAVTVAAAEFGITGPANAQSNEKKTVGISPV